MPVFPCCREKHAVFLPEDYGPGWQQLCLRPATTDPQHPLREH